MAKVTVTELKRDRIGGRTEMVVVSGTPASADDYIDAGDVSLGTLYASFANGFAIGGTPQGIAISATTPDEATCRSATKQRFVLIGESAESTGGD